MEHVYSLLKALFRDPKRLWTTLVAVASTLGAAIGIYQVDLRNHIRTALIPAGFFEVSVDHRQADALIERIQEIDQSSPDHPFIRRLRTLSMEGKSPFQGLKREIRIWQGAHASRGYVVEVCPNSELLYTYLQYATALPTFELVTLRAVPANTCDPDKGKRDEVHVNPELWDKLVASPGISNTTLKMDVLLHYPDPTIRSPTKD